MSLKGPRRLFGMHENSILLTVRGTHIPPTLDACRVLHNETAGSAPGIAAARALGDLSHKVYAPHGKGKPGELLFIDVWQDPKGLFEFFSNKAVLEQGGKLFSARDATVWLPAKGSFSYRLEAPAGKNDRFVGLVRGPVKSPEAAVATFTELDRKAQRKVRALGLMSHAIFLKLPAPGDTSGPELLGVDVWFDEEGMRAHYNDPDELAGMKDVFSGRPDPTTWVQAPGAWSEW